MTKSRTWRGPTLALGLGLVLWTSFGSAGIEFQTGSVQGTVKTNSGVVVPGAQVRAIATAGGSSQFTSVNGMGAYTFQLPVGEYRIEATYEQIAIGTPHVVSLAPQETRTGENFTFAAGTVRTHVTRNGTDDVGAQITISEAAPVPGCAEPTATCEILEPTTCKCHVPGGRDYFCMQGLCTWANQLSFQSTTGAAGVSTKLVPAGTYTVRVNSSSGSAMGGGGPPGMGMMNQSGWIEVGSTSPVVVADGAVDVNGGDILYDTGEVTGHITAGGLPYTNATVRADAGPLGQVTAWVDGTGGYTLRLPSSPTYTVTAVLDSTTPLAPITNVNVVPGSPIVHDFAIPGGFLTGVVTRDGTPISGAQIQISEEAPTSCAAGTNCVNDPQKGCFCDLDGRKFWCDVNGYCSWFDNHSLSAGTDANGSFNRFVPSGAYVLRISSANEMGMGMPGMMMQMGTVLVRTLPATITNDATTNIGTVNYVTGLVTGTLTSCGAPLQGSVQALKADFSGSLSVSTNMNGTYTLRAPEGTYGLVAQWQGNTFQVLPNATVASGVPVSFSASHDTGQMRGLILRDGLPADGMMVQIVEATPALSCAPQYNCFGDPGKPDECLCDLNGRKFSCRPPMGCQFADSQFATAFTGADGFFTATTLPGTYEVILYSGSGGGMGPPPGKMGGGYIRAGSVFATVNACALTEVNIDTAAQPVVGGTPTNLGDGILLTFPSGTTGTASFTASSTPPDNAPPPQFNSVGLYYDFTVPPFSGNVEICLPYDVDLVQGQPLALFHYVGGVWVDVTTSVNTTTNVVCGNTTSFSFFAVGTPKVTTALVANIVAPAQVSADGACKGHVHFDGSASTGATSYRWLLGDTLLGQGQTLDALLPLGPSTVKLIVASNASTQSTTATVNVIDDTPPSIGSLTVSPSVLWPPDGKLVSIAPTLVAHDNCDPSPKITILDASSPTAVPADIAISQPAGVSVRAFRAGKETSGRTYTLRYQVSDSAGNRTSSTATVLVPHDKSN